MTQKPSYEALEQRIKVLEAASLKGKRTEEALRAAEDKYRILVENANDIIYRTDALGRITFYNPVAVKYFGYPEADLIGKHYTEFVHPGRRIELERFYGRQFVKKIPITYYEFPLLLRDKRVVWLGQNVQLIIDNGQVTGFHAIARDITERKQAADALRDSEKRYRLLVENAHEAIIVIQDGAIKFLNSKTIASFGYSEAELLSIPVLELIHPEDRDEVIQRYLQKINGDATPSLHSYRLLLRGGRIQWIEVSSILISWEDRPATLNLIMDITDRKKTEEALRKSEEKYRLIFEHSPLGHFYFDEKGVIVACNDNFVKLIGSTKDAIVGINMLRLPDKKLAASIQKALNGDTAFYEDVYHSTTAGKATPVRAFFEPIKVGDQGILGGVAIVEDVTNHKRAEENLQKSLEQLRRALQATIQALSQIMETKDPYTSEHQKRTTNLARAIATEMHLTSDQIEGIRVAGAIHDIGKLSVPAEILSKPSKLAAAEYSLIKEHARQGYEILKDVESPWPLAEIVHQHHERMNGSGYPRGLQGEKILIEARILAVADVVEAMASYRPYRPALGIDKALEEIENNKGVLYDTLATDACLRLFKEKGFKIDG
ncbi:MAG TPA: PAS domain S-box protein [Smithellaceae bacterium]|nr:PAS domain S-box protein [Smithellaceae bacterium]